MPTFEFTFVDPNLPIQLLDSFQSRPDHMIPAPYSVLSSDATIWETKINLEDLLSENDQ